MISTGFESLDKVITGLRKGDNVVWQVGQINEYIDFARAFVDGALKDDRKVIYMRFSSHPPLFSEGKNIRIYQLDASSGFESFTTRVNEIITQEGHGACYVFDCLSDLLPAWAADCMIANFFVVTCPYLFELDTIAYFSILRDHHSFKTVARIRETTQLLVDIYNCEGVCYLHPLKVWNRYTGTMFLPHMREGDRFLPLTDSANAARLLSHIMGRKEEEPKRNLDYWDRLFLEAEELLHRGASKKERIHMFSRLARIMVTRDSKIMDLVEKNFTLEDLVNMKSRLIGTGFVGGKAAGMLLSRNILLREKSLNWEEISEAHDSFYVGSDVFYTYLVQNGWWKLRMAQKTPEGYFEAARLLKEKMFFGKFPDEVMEQFQQMIEYFGTSPIIVRSSSLLEDGFGNAFAGKYESIFCPNQGTPEERYLKFSEAVRKVYASTMSEEAINYRLDRGLHERDEQMALLIQRVSGSYHQNYFFPDMAGVGISYNTYVWNEKLNAQAGMVRLVAGLGTRAVNRVEGDYARIVALDEPLLKPYSDMEDIRRFSQHDVDVVDIKDNSFKAVPFSDLMSENLQFRFEEIAVKDEEMCLRMEQSGRGGNEYWVLTFDRLLARGPLVEILGKILKTLEREYWCPVDIEFTVNYAKDQDFKINLLQCRPLQTRGLGKKVEIPDVIPADKVLFESRGCFLGGNIVQPIRQVIYVRPGKYLSLTLRDKYEIARIVGNLNKLLVDREKTPAALIGPGRWGTSTPSLGVPVSFFEINKISVLCEVAFDGGNLVPELSFGTHFFQDLVESNIFYAALFPQKKDSLFREEWLQRSGNILGKLLPKSEKYRDVVGAYDVSSRNLKVASDISSQRIVCFSGE